MCLEALVNLMPQNEQMPLMAIRPARLPVMTQCLPVLFAIEQERKSPPLMLAVGCHQACWKSDFLFCDNGKYSRGWGRQLVARLKWAEDSRKALAK